MSTIHSSMLKGQRPQPAVVELQREDLSVVIEWTLAVLHELELRYKLGLGAHGAVCAGNLVHGEDTVELTRSDDTDVVWQAPERLRSGLPSVSDDLYAVGVLLYALAEGRLPFASGDAWAVQHSRAPISERLPGKIAELAFTAMSKRPNMRFDDPADFRRALERAWTAHTLAHCGVKVHDDPVDWDTLEPAPERRLSAAVQQVQSVWPWVFAGAVGAGLLGMGLGVLLFTLLNG